ncbi:MAG: hypothetical protein JJT85_12310 [Chromatiales bacterium]|nr:hypothetical protein [Chromatiales bacterium]
MHHAVRNLLSRSMLAGAAAAAILAFGVSLPAAAANVQLVGFSASGGADFDVFDVSEPGLVTFDLDFFQPGLATLSFDWSDAQPGDTLAFNAFILNETGLPFASARVGLTGASFASVGSLFEESRPPVVDVLPNGIVSVLFQPADFIIGNPDGLFPGAVDWFINLPGSAGQFDLSIGVTVVPVPAAVWLFLSALGTLSVAGSGRFGRKQA